MTTARQGERRPAGGGPEGFSYTKALILVVVAVVVGAYLLQLGNGSGTTSATTAPTVPTTTTTTAPTSTTTTGATPSQAVKVLVANASNTNGVAGFYTTKLAAAGWGTLTATDATTTEPTSTVYYASGQQAAAGAIATSLGLTSSAVQALGSATPVQGTTGASVVVVVGNDLAAKATPTTTTTAAS